LKSPTPKFWETPYAHLGEKRAKLTDTNSSVVMNYWAGIVEYPALYIKVTVELSLREF
jgi:hypothetical protein